MFVIYTQHASICAQLPACSETKLDGKHEKKVSGKKDVGRSQCRYFVYVVCGKKRTRKVLRLPSPNDRFDIFFHFVSRNSLHVTQNTQNAHKNILPTRLRPGETSTAHYSWRCDGAATISGQQQCFRRVKKIRN